MKLDYLFVVILIIKTVFKMVWVIKGL